MALMIFNHSMRMALSGAMMRLRYRRVEASPAKFVVCFRYGIVAPVSWVPVAGNGHQAPRRSATR